MAVRSLKFGRPSNLKCETDFVKIWGQKFVKLMNMYHLCLQYVNTFHWILYNLGKMAALLQEILKSRTVGRHRIWRHRCKSRYSAVVTDCGQFVKLMVCKWTFVRGQLVKMLNVLEYKIRNEIL